ncbi:MAG: DNA methyltransferase [Phycisphaerae bacterium]|nr:DNA methyltransferase [Phycisphaerae bacterium]
MDKYLNKIVCGDCIEILSGIEEPFADLVFADPPFNIGYQYDKYHDKVKSKNYLDWSRDWIKACKNVLKPYGSFYIAIGDDYAAQLKLIAEDLGLIFRNWIIWHYTFGQQTKAKFARAHTHIFYFVNDKKNFTFNDFAVRVPSDRQLIYNDKRADSRGKMPDDVWNQFSRICGTFKEREGWHPCQMPESVLKRIITVSSNPGDTVLDPFMGSGTTAAATVQLNRNFFGTELSQDYAQNALKRIEALKESESKNLFLSFTPLEITELKRLFTDMNIPTASIVNNQNLLSLFTNQFNLRMNNGKKHNMQTIAAALENLQLDYWNNQAAKTDRTNVCRQNKGMQKIDNLF